MTGEQAGISDPTQRYDPLRVVVKGPTIGSLGVGPIRYRPDCSDLGTIEDVVRDQDHLPHIALPSNPLSVNPLSVRALSSSPYPFEPKRILDLGCNIGATMASYHHYFPNAEIIGYEIDPDNVKMARMNTQHFNGSVYEAAVCEYSRCGLDIPYDKPHLGWNACRVQSCGDHSAKGLCLSCISQLGPFDLIKIDIEGMEGDVIPDIPQSLLAEKAMIIVECHPPWSHTEIIQQLTKHDLFTTRHARHDNAVVAWRLGR